LAYREALNGRDEGSRALLAQDRAAKSRPGERIAGAAAWQQLKFEKT
jgi:hypothetical protein